MKIIDGKEIAKGIKLKLKEEIHEKHLTPGLAIINIGNNPASEIYIKNKSQACNEVGIKEKLYQFKESVTEEEIINCIVSLNQDKSIHGIIVQDPLPNHLDASKIINYIDSAKDVDGFGISSLGHLASNNETFLAATPYGIIKLLEHENITIAGKNIVIIGRSQIVGRPLALALLNRDATVTIAHSKTKNLKDLTKNADILIVAVGKPKFLTNVDIKDNAVIIDVGINRTENGIVGDVDFDSCKEKASYITPVPGGVGPMTIAMLLTNVVTSCKNNIK